MKTRTSILSRASSLILFAALIAASLARPSLADDMKPDAASHHLNVKFQDVRWQRIFPDFGAKSAEMAILHSDPLTKATQLLIRVPKNAHVPTHWHTANETHTVISGTFVMEAEGMREALGPGSFNYVPSKMPHEAWTTKSEGALLFITVDGPWDVNWVNGPPKAADLVGGVAKPSH